MKELLIGLLTKDFVDFGEEDNWELEHVFEPPKRTKYFARLKLKHLYIGKDLGSFQFSGPR